MKIIIVLITLVSITYGFYPNNAFKSFFWTQKENDSMKSGCYGYVQIDSVITFNDEIKLLSSFWLTYEWWFLRFKMSYMQTEINLSKGNPPSILRCSGHFKNVEWFTGFKRTNSSDSIRFYFPLLPQGQLYGRYDYFTVDIDQDLDLEFYGAGDSIMVGTFVHKRPAANGAVNILGRNAIILELTDANPFRIKTIFCDGNFDSLLTIYLKYELDTLKLNEKWYGIDILDTLTHVPKIVVSSVDIEGQEPHLVGTNKNIIWKLEGKNEIDSCLVTVSYDKMSWLSLGSTELDTMLNWTISNQASDSTVIKVIAYGKHGERIAATKENMQFYMFLNVLSGLRIY